MSQESNVNNKPSACSEVVFSTDSSEDLDPGESRNELSILTNLSILDNQPHASLMNKFSITHSLEAAEVLHRILSFVEKASLPNCARVCRRWMTPSVTILWRDLWRVGFKPLVSLLGDCSEERGSIVFGPNGALPCRWPRYHIYSTLVRSLAIDATNDSVKAKDTQARPGIHWRTLLQMNALAAANRSFVLPNIQELGLSSWAKSASETLVFLINDSLETVSMDWLNQNDWGFVTTLKRLTFCPRLTSLTLLVDESVIQQKDTCAAIGELLPSLIALETLKLPTRLVLHQHHIWSAVQSLQHLSHLGNWREPVYNDILGPPCGDVHMSAGFPNLERLSMKMQCDALVHILRFGGPISMRTMDLVLTGASIPASISAVVFIISESLPSLTSLSLTFDSVSTRIGMEELLPITRLKKLTELSLFCDGTHRLTDKDVAKLTRNLSSLVELHLFPDPVNNNPPPCTLLALSYIARNCPAMQCLSLSLDARPSALPTFSLQITPFSKSLKFLSFGLSSVEDHTTLSVCLARHIQHCQPEIFLDGTGTTRSSLANDNELNEKYRSALETWTKVTKLAETVKMCFAAMEKAKDVEIQTLRGRVSELETNANAGLGRAEVKIEE